MKTPIITTDQFGAALAFAMMAMDDDPTTSIALTPDQLDLREDSDYTEKELNNLIEALMEFYPGWDGDVSGLDDQVRLLSETEGEVKLSGQLDVEGNIVLIVGEPE